MIGVAFVLTTPQRTRIKQDNYYNSIDYYFKGKCISFKELDIERYLITIDVDSIKINKSNINKENYYSGIFDPNTYKVYYLLNITDDDYPDYLEVDTKVQKIMFIYKDTTIERTMRPWHLYLEDLEKIQTSEMIKL